VRGLYYQLQLHQKNIHTQSMHKIIHGIRRIYHFYKKIKIKNKI
jgi:hypothetical protein